MSLCSLSVGFSRSHSSSIKTVGLAYIFIEFIVLVLLSHLDYEMKETNLYKMYTMQQLLDTLDVIECFENKSHALRIGELLNKQAAIYETLGVAPRPCHVNARIQD